MTQKQGALTVILLFAKQRLNTTEEKTFVSLLLILILKHFFRQSGDFFLTMRISYSGLH